MAFSKVQSNHSNTGGGGGTTLALAFPASVTSGNLVRGCVTWGSDATGSITLSSVTDDKGNAYFKSSLIDTTVSQGFATFWLGNITNAPKTITATFSATNTFQGMNIEEWSGVAALSDPSDGHTGQIQSSVSSTAADAITSGTITTTQNGDLIGADTMDDGGVIPSAGTGFTLQESDNASGAGVSQASESMTQTTAGAVAGTFTQATANHPWVTFVIAFKAAGGGAASFLPYDPWPQWAPVLAM